MNIKLSVHVLGIFLKFFGLFMLVPAIVSFIYKDGDLYIFLLTSILTTTLGFLLENITKACKHVNVMERKDAFFIAFLCWIVACLVGAVPYFLVPLPVFSHPVYAIFESVSGFTTTGATIVTDIESLPHGILFYRSFTQWLGGMGIVVLGIAILPKLSVGGVQLMGSESPGPIMEKITPKIAQTAKKLWLVYIALSLILVGCLYLAGMPVFDSITTSFSTLSTGGFSVRNASIESYASPFIEAILTFFMFLGGISFLLHYYVFTGRFSKVIKNSELRFYLLLTLVFISITTINLWGHQYQYFIDALRYGSFQVVSILTTTGFSSADFDLWPSLSVFMIMVMMFIGACAGSTSGSIKQLRVLILIKKVFSREINHLVKPKAVLPVRINTKPVNEDVISSVTSFFVLYLVIFILSVFVILAVEDISIIGAISACASSIGNVGPGFGEVGATHNYMFLSSFSKLWLCMLMILGRLELFTVIVIFSPMFWRK